MGKIYEFSEIRNNQIPQVEDFLKAKSMILEEGLQKLIKEGEIYGAKVFGSVGKGNPNERSDFDIVIVTLRDSSLPLLRDFFDTVTKKTNVGIEPLIVQKEFAEIGAHSIDALYLEHIHSISDIGNVVGLNPLNVINPCSDLHPKMVYKQYLIQKLRRFNEGFFVHSEADKNKVLQRALEEPVNLGRRTIQVLPYFGFPTEMEDDGKQTVIKFFQETFGKTPLVFGFDSLLQQDKDYTLFLKRTLRSQLTQDEYEARLNKLNECIPQALAWTTEMTRMCIKLLEGDKKTVEGIPLHRRKEALG